MKHFFKIYSFAFQSLTIFWHGPSIKTSPIIRAKAIIFYPLVGLFIGVLLNFFHMGCQTILPEDIADFLVIIAWSILSRASHLRGLAFILENVTSNFKVESNLTTAKQRLGVFAALLLIISQLIKFFSLLCVIPILKTAAIISMPIASLWAVVWACYLLSFSTDSSKSRFTTWVTVRELNVASIITFCMLFLFIKLKALIALIIVMLKTFVLIKWIQLKNPELAESTLGAIHEFGGILFLLSLKIPFFYDF